MQARVQSAPVDPPATPLPHPCHRPAAQAQLAFSLFISVALFARSFSALPFAVLGFWKMVRSE